MKIHHGEMSRRNLEAQDRISRKNNVLVRGKNWTESNTSKEATDFLSTYFQLTNVVLKAWKVGPSGHVAVIKLASWEAKLHIMRNKKVKLEGTSIFID